MKMTLTLLVLGLGGALTAAPAQDLRENSFFKALAGSWTGTGQITFTGQAPQPMKNRIKAGFDASGTLFTIEGALVLENEAANPAPEPTLYRWEFRPSKKDGGLCEGLLITLNDKSEPDRYEVSFDTSTLSAKIVPTSPGAGKDRMELSKQIKGNEYISRTTFYNAAGERTACSEMKFARTP